MACARVVGDFGGLVPARNGLVFPADPLRQLAQLKWHRSEARRERLCHHRGYHGATSLSRMAPAVSIPAGMVYSPTVKVGLSWSRLFWRPPEWKQGGRPFLFTGCAPSAAQRGMVRLHVLVPFGKPVQERCPQLFRGRGVVRLVWGGRQTGSGATTDSPQAGWGWGR